LLSSTPPGMANVKMGLGASNRSPSENYTSPIALAW